MNFSAVRLTGGVKQTGKRMHWLAREFSFDMAPYNSYTITEVFQKIADIPFKPDPEGHELVQRPRYTMQFGGDCDDKAIAAASYFFNRGIPYQFRAVGFGHPNGPKNRIPLSHVFVEYKLGGEWIAFDATYSYNLLGQQPDYSRSEII